MKTLNNDKQMKDVWTGGLTPGNEKKYGKHPTQKPLYIIERIIESSSKEGDIILDTFIGSGTTAVASKKQLRKFIGFDNSKEYLSIAEERINNMMLHIIFFKEHH